VVANAAALAATLSDEGLRIVSGGTDNHLMLVDVSAVGLTGAAAEALLGRVGITCNKNLIPYDKEPPMSASGIRIGTAAVTTRGLGVPQMESLGRLIAECLKRPDDDACARRVEADVAELTAAFPIRQTAGV
jgi:glycine hydroxymethyltransferase